MNHRRPCLGQLGLELPRISEGRPENAARHSWDLRDLQLLDPHLQDLAPELMVPHLYHVLQPLTLGPLRGIEPRDLEHGVLLQQLDEPLPDHPRCSQDTDLYLRHLLASEILAALDHDPHERLLVAFHSRLPDVLEGPLEVPEGLRVMGIEMLYLLVELSVLRRDGTGQLHLAAEGGGPRPFQLLVPLAALAQGLEEGDVHCMAQT